MIERNENPLLPMGTWIATPEIQFAARFIAENLLAGTIADAGGEREIDVEIDDQIATISIRGMICVQRSRVGDFIGTSVPSLLKKLVVLTEDPRCCAILIQFDEACGGPCEGLVKAAMEIGQLSRKKPIFARCTDRTTAGAYLLASAAERIFSHQTCFVGGVWMAAPSIEGNVVRFHRVTDHRRDRFIRTIGRNRGLSVGDARAILKDEPHLGIVAEQNGLVDRLCGEDDMLTEIHARALARKNREMK